jgi:hypothetical protein
MKKILPKVLQKESDIKCATWKNNTQNSGNILNDRFSYEQKKYIPTEEELVLVLKLKLAPEKSLCQLAVQSEMSKFSLHWAIIILKQHVYKNRVEQLLPLDLESISCYCRWFQESEANGFLYLELMFSWIRHGL